MWNKVQAFAANVYALGKAHPIASGLIASLVFGFALGYWAG